MRNYDVEIHHPPDDFTVTRYLDHLVKVLRPDARPVGYVGIREADAGAGIYGSRGIVGIRSHGKKRPRAGEIDDDVQAEIVRVVAAPDVTQFTVGNRGTVGEDRKFFLLSGVGLAGPAKAERGASTARSTIKAATIPVGKVVNHSKPPVPHGLTGAITGSPVRNPIATL